MTRNREAGRHTGRMEGWQAGVTLAALPIVTWIAYLAGGELALMIAAITIPILLVCQAVLRAHGTARRPHAQPVLFSRDDLVEEAEALRAAAARTNRQAAVIILEVDERNGVVDRHGPRGLERLTALTLDRLRGVLREDDTLALLEETRFGIVVGPMRRLDLEACIQLSARLQTAAAEPIADGRETMVASLSAGFVISKRMPRTDGAGLVEAAETAAGEAHRNGPGAIRAYSPDMTRQAPRRSRLHQQIGDALEDGQIIAHFQPQLSTETGRISGFEALARWQHPENGLIPPAEFLPVVHESGLTERLAEVMLYQSLLALRQWDDGGADVPSIGVNFAGAELRDPKLVEKIGWEIDRFDLSPERLNVEILETVLADSEGGVITRNIQGLARLGCRIDLDDFGIGQASIAHIQHFAVNRIKIDRSFISRVDTEESQRRLVSAILMMADELGVETLAEGVETKGEHAILAQLGCRHVQGFGIARPMDKDAALAWSLKHKKAVGAPIDLHQTMER